MYHELVRLDLRIFFEEPDEANLMVVLEFYANCPEHDAHVCIVRKKKVDFSKEAIRRAYYLPEFVKDLDTGDYYETHNREPYLWRLLFATICVPGKEVVWIKKGQKFHSASLTFEGKCWVYIINNRLLPSGS